MNPQPEAEPLFRLVTRRTVVRRALIMALIVGHVLAAINHGDRILSGTMSPGDWGKVLLTFLVPYTVSTISSVLAISEQRHGLHKPAPQKYATCPAEGGQS
ncbi:nitrate/nitrite transporter NrtS [Litoreibacter roseus]|uniref:Phosphoenolpyruvate protein kinase n=1 Tax=Litoreibacter roseus TaxID=2601869 RepID=A0A6N6JJY0_9RHOB|nr:nitrate/nitrite transporter NrtS [Litoreibacter roseus]GFE66170.1 hypothetical protein KIN_32440 [Litoreibacter roseus]